MIRVPEDLDLGVKRFQGMLGMLWDRWSVYGYRMSYNLR